MKLIVVAGARPHFVKVAPLVCELAGAGHQVDIAFTGSRSRDRDEAGAHPEPSFYGVQVPHPTWFLDIGEGTHGVETGQAMMALESLFIAEEPDAVIVIGDVNATLAGAVSAAKAGIPVVHLEAGLRCGDMSVPEEINRLLISRVAALHLAPTEDSIDNLVAEGIDPARIQFVGNIMAEAVLRNIDEVVDIHAAALFGLERRAYVLASFHRPENLAHPARVSGILQGLAALPMPVLLPDQGPFRSALESARLGVPDNLMLADAVSYADMIALQHEAACVVTDSSGVQVEACIVQTPCVTVRVCTEHKATLEVGANRLSDALPSSIIAAATLAQAHRSWVTPKRWDNAVSGRIARALKRGVTPLGC